MAVLNLWNGTEAKTSMLRLLVQYLPLVRAVHVDAFAAAFGPETRVLDSACFVQGHGACSPGLGPVLHPAKERP